MTYPCNDEFEFTVPGNNGTHAAVADCTLTIPFANGVHVHLFNEDFMNPSRHMRAYVGSKATDEYPEVFNLHFRDDCPGNRELDGEGLAKLLAWAAALPAFEEL